MRHERVAHEVRYRNDGHGGWVLEAEKHSEQCALVGRQIQNAFALEENVALRDGVFRVAHEGERQRALTGPVWAHKRVHGSAIDDQVDSADDFLVSHVDVKIAYFEQSVSH